MFAFDNSSGHSVFAADALLAHNMNLKPGGKKPLMRPSYFNGQPQSMVFPDNHPVKALRVKPKGMRVVLTERVL